MNCLINRGMPLTTSMVRNFAEEIIQDDVGHNWISDFVKRHQNRLHSQSLRNIDKKRCKAESAILFQEFYDKVSGQLSLISQILTMSQLQAAIERFNITADHIYNWDEKGFIIGHASAVKRIMSKHAVRSGRIPYAC